MLPTILASRGAIQRGLRTKPARPVSTIRGRRRPPALALNQRQLTEPARPEANRLLSTSFASTPTVCLAARSDFETMLAMPAHELRVGSIGFAGRREDATARIH